MQITAKFTNLGAVLRSLDALSNEIQGAYAKQLYQSAEEVMTAAKELTPVDLGNLRGSGHVQLPELQNGVVSVQLGFGGPAGTGNHGGETNKEDVGYAEIVHEDLNANHTVGKAKFLEEPFEAMRPDIQNALDDAVTEAIRKAGLQ